MVRKILKWIGIVLAGLIGLLIVAFVVLVIVGGGQFNKTVDVPAETIPIPTGVEAIERGEHVALIHYCQRCHLNNLGGELSFAIPGLLSIPTPNLTSGAGGVGSFYTDADWERAIRHGVGHDGRALWIMPSENFSHLSDEDMGTLIAYLKSVPPVDNELADRKIEPLGRVMVALGMMPPVAADRIDHMATATAVIEPAVSVEYGAYLARTMCTECHGVNLNGVPFGPPGQEVPSPNLTPGGELATWTEEQFMATLRTGITPDGHHLNKEMPWPYFGQMTDDEMQALWLYLHSLPALAQGGMK